MSNGAGRTVTRALRNGKPSLHVISGKDHHNHSLADMSAALLVDLSELDEALDGVRVALDRALARAHRLSQLAGGGV